MAEMLEGVVDRIRYVNEETQWTVATVKSDGVAWPSTVVGALPGLMEGMRVRAEGTWNSDRRWGRQFKVQTYVEIVPASQRGIRAYLASGFIPGIGEKMAERIVEMFGDDTLKVIEEEPERIGEVSGLGAKRVQSIIDTFQQRRGTRAAFVFLYDLGITPGLAAKIYQRYQRETVTLIRKNPYRLAEDVHGIGFRKADQVANALSIERDHPDRVRAAAYHVLMAARDEGHCFLVQGALVEAASHLADVDPIAVEAGIRDLALAGKVLLEQWPHDPTESAVYPLYLFDAETRFASAVVRLLQGARGASEKGEHQREVALRVARAAKGLGITLTEEQEETVNRALGSGMIIVTGGPGTGKTTIIQTLLKASGHPAHRIALGAPTGRASKRMAEATGYAASTIHRLLEFSPKEGSFQRDENHPLDVDLLVVDEASMMDILLFDALIRAVELGTSVVLVGDVDQLPPVGPGSPLADLIRSGRVPVARLTRIFRQSERSAIVDCAHRINRGLVPEVTPAGTPIQDFYFIQRATPEDVLATIEELVTERIPQRFGMSPMRDIQVLSPMRQGMVGVLNINQRLQELLNPSEQKLVVGATDFRLGDRVMQVRNDYERGVFNGDTGTIITVDQRAATLIVDIDERPIIYDRNQLDELVLAYAVSVHKSQGSEYPAVVLPVVTQHFKMLQRNLIYTGITRGRSLVVVVGTERAMGIAVRNQHVASRNSLLADRLSSSDQLFRH